jgi:beta-fructofuranosidase
MGADVAALPEKRDEIKMPDETRMRSALEAADAEIARRQSEVAAGARRLRYHLMAPVGSMGDPNGLVHFRGQYHVLFQFVPYFPHNEVPEQGQSGVHWGHYVSDDLVNWRLLPTAISPSEDYDAWSCMSGSGIVDDDGRLVVIYSGAGTTGVTQDVAVSDDGVVFHKAAANPVIPVPPEGFQNDFRDPKMFEHEGATYAVVGASAVGTSPGGRGRVLLYRAGDSLLDWSFVGVASEADMLGGLMWECPDLFPLGDRFALIFSLSDGMLASPAVIQVGSFDPVTGAFVSESGRQVLDAGDLYAPQTFVDDSGRRILFGWMGHRDRTDMTAHEGWYGALTLPRELVLVDGRVRQRPVKELETLRGAPQVLGPVTVGAEGLRADAGETSEVRLVVGAESARKFRVALRASADRSEQTCFIVDRDAGRFVCERGLSGAGPATASVAEYDDRPGELEVRFFLDTTAVEAFIDEGAAALANLIYPDPTSTGLIVEPIGTGTLDVVSLTIWPLNV